MRGRQARLSVITVFVVHRLPGENMRWECRLHLPSPRHPSVPSFLELLLHSNHCFPPPHPHTPNIFNYICSQVVRLSNQGADIDACADKSANTGNKINKDFEERVTANFAQWSVPHSRVMFLIEQATPENSCLTQERGWNIALLVSRHLHFLNCFLKPFFLILWFSVNVAHHRCCTTYFCLSNSC